MLEVKYDAQLFMKFLPFVFFLAFVISGGVSAPLCLLCPLLLRKLTPGAAALIDPSWIGLALIYLPGPFHLILLKKALVSLSIRMLTHTATLSHIRWAGLESFLYLPRQSLSQRTEAAN